MDKPFWFIFVAPIMGLVVGIPSCNHYTNHVKPIEEAKNLVKADLNDPESAQFRNVRIHEFGSVCGEVNARNRFGGYVGFRYFEVSGSSTKRAFIDSETLHLAENSCEPDHKVPIATPDR